MSPEPDFIGFPAAAFEWFGELEANNTREWFNAHRDTYEHDVRDPVDTFLHELAEEVGGEVKLFRQHRDVRFSKDKSPYKLTTYGVIRERPDSRAALYAQLSAAGLFAGTGYYMIATDQLARLREGIADDRAGPALEAAVADAEAAGVELFGSALKTAPRGYPRDHPRIRLLRMKSLVAGARLHAGRKGIARDAALDHARTTWDTCAPLNAWLDAHVGDSTLPEPERPGRGGRPR